MQDTLITHSPGPWRVDPIPESAHTDPDIMVDKDAVLWISEDRGDGEVLALVQIVSDRNGGNAVANGKLIAAAPELLDSCRELRDAMTVTLQLVAEHPSLIVQLNAALRGAGISLGFGTRADAAIAKAERG